MKARQIIFFIILIVAGWYFGNKYLSEMSILSESAVSFFGIMLIVLIIGWAISRVLKA